MPTNKENTEKAAPALPEKVEKALVAWENAAVETLGPKISTEAYNCLTQLRANLRAVLVSALSS